MIETTTRAWGSERPPRRLFLTTEEREEREFIRIRNKFLQMRFGVKVNDLYLETTTQKERIKIKDALEWYEQRMLIQGPPTKDEYQRRLGEEMVEIPKSWLPPFLLMKGLCEL